MAKGDVHFGSFYTDDNKMLRHYMVEIDRVTMSGVTFVRGVYTTTLKHDKGADPRHTFTSADKRSMGLPNDARWDAGQVSLTPATELRCVGRVTAATMNLISQEFVSRKQRRSVAEVAGMATEQHNLVLARAC